MRSTSMASVGPEPVSAVYLQPAALWVGGRDEACRTLLGSCVAVCLWDPERRVGGMNHYQLPQRTGRSGRDALRFAEPALVALRDGVLERGARASALQARIFGGAHVLKVLTGNHDLGLRNVEQAEQFLAEHGIPVVERRTGGDVGLRVVFRSGDGASWVRPMGQGGR